MTKRRLLALALWLAALTGLMGGCTQYPKIAATYEGGEIPAGVYIYYQASAMRTPASEEEGSVEERAMNSARRFAAVEAECAARGITLDESTEEYIKASIEMQWAADKEIFERNGIAQSSAMAISRNISKSTLLFEALYGTLGEQPVEDAELEEMYRQQYRRIMMMVLPKFDQNMTPLSEEGLAEHNKLVEEYRALADSGTGLFELIVKYDEYQHLTQETPHEHGELVESEQETVVSINSTTYPPDMLEQIFGSDEEGIRVYDNDNYTVFYELRELIGDGSHYISSRTALRQEARGEEYEQFLNGVADGLSFTPNAQAVKVYTSDKLDFGS